MGKSYKNNSQEDDVANIYWYGKILKYILGRNKVLVSKNTHFKIPIGKF